MKNYNKVNKQDEMYCFIQVIQLVDD